MWFLQSSFTWQERNYFERFVVLGRPATAYRYSSATIYFVCLEASSAGGSHVGRTNSFCGPQNFSTAQDHNLKNRDVRLDQTVRLLSETYPRWSYAIEQSPNTSNQRMYTAALENKCRRTATCGWSLDHITSTSSTLVYTVVFIQGTKQALRHCTINRTHLGTLVSPGTWRRVTVQLVPDLLHSEVLAVRWECREEGGGVSAGRKCSTHCTPAMCAHLSRYSTGTPYQHRPDRLTDYLTKM